MIRNLRLAAIFWIALVGVAALVPSQLQAQSFYGSLAGTITDSSGAVIPNATVIATNPGTNEKRTVTTNAAGEYRIMTLVPAQYKVEVTATNFKRFVQNIVPVRVDAVTSLNAALQVGAADQTVEVSTETPLLQTESGEVSSQVQGETVTEMPLNGRNVMNLVATTPGVVPGRGAMGAAGMNNGNHTDIVGFNDYSIGGGQSGYTADYVDGAPDNVLSQNATGFIPTQDATQEFKVASNSVSAEYGRFGGGVVSMTTKSGTNRLHGTLYEYFRNTVLNANNFFDGSAYNSGRALPVPKWNQNQYGAEVDGPIKKDKAFFMFSWERYSQLTAPPSPTNVPGDGTHGTTNMAGYASGSNTPGTAAAVFSDQGGTRVISDPSGKCPSGAGGITHDAIAGTYTIPVSCFDVTGAALLHYWGRPNATPSSASPYNFSVSPEMGDNTSQYNSRVDYHLGNKQLLFARYTYWKLDDIGEDPMKNTTASLKSTFASTHVHAHSAVLGDTYTVNPNTVADIRLSYLRQVFTNFADQYNNANFSTFGGVYPTLSSQFSFKSQPNVNLVGPDNIQFIIPQDAVQLEQSNFYSINANLTRIFGRHTTKYGFEGRLSMRDSIGNNPDYGGFSFFFANGVPYAAGDEVASMILGDYFFDQINTVVPVTTVNQSFAFYGLDDWKIGRNLTVNLGIRWELPGGMEEKKDRTAVLLPNTVDPDTGFTGTMAIVNSKYYSGRSMEPIRHNLFSPRASFAERLGNSSVVRGGVSLLILPPDLSGGTQAFFSPVASAFTKNTNLSFLPFHYWESNPFPGGILQPTLRTKTTLGQYELGQDLAGPLPNSRYPYVFQFNLAVSRQWKGGWTTEISGVGAKGTYLPIGATNGTPNNSNFELDQVPTQDYVWASSGNWNAATGTAYSGQSLNAPASCVGNPNNSVGQCLRPYPQFSGYSDYSHNAGNSFYSAMYATLQKRFGGGGVLNANYSWFKSIDNVGSGQWVDFYNPKQARTLSGFDVDQRVNISYVLDLPFGKGKRWAADAHGVAGALVSGWAVNGITTLQSGNPLSFSASGNSISSNLVGESQAPNPFAYLIAGCNPKGSGSVFQRVTTNSWFNGNCFATPGSAASYPNPFGNMKANYGGVRQQGTTNFDFSLAKATSIGEHANAQFRIETFNLFNHPQFQGPGTTLGGGGFGGGWDQINKQQNNPRLIQASLRIKF